MILLDQEVAQVHCTLPELEPTCRAVRSSSKCSSSQHTQDMLALLLCCYPQQTLPSCTTAGSCRAREVEACGMRLICRCDRPQVPAFLLLMHASRPAFIPTFVLIRHQVAGFEFRL